MYEQGDVKIHGIDGSTNVFVKKVAVARILPNHCIDFTSPVCSSTLVENPVRQHEVRIELGRTQDSKARNLSVADNCDNSIERS